MVSDVVYFDVVHFENVYCLSFGFRDYRVVHSGQQFEAGGARIKILEIQDEACLLRVGQSSRLVQRLRPVLGGQETTPPPLKEEKRG